MDGGPPQQLDPLWTFVACTIAWAMAAVLGVRAIAVAHARAPADVRIASLLAVAAAAMRFALPWGPLNFVDPERLVPFTWGDLELQPGFAGVPSALRALVAIGVPPGALLRAWGPLMGGVGVATTYACARVMRLDRRASLLAATCVALAPAHLHYATSPSMSVETGALATAALAALAVADVAWVTVPLPAALVALTVYARPEWRLVVVPAAVLALSPAWSWRARFALGASTLALLAPYLPQVIAPGAALSFASGCTRDFFQNPPGRYFLGPGAALVLLGLACGVAPVRARVALGLAIAGPLLVYWRAASDPSPYWGQWRYFVTLVPLGAIAFASLVPRVASRWPRAAWAVAFAIPLAVLATAAPGLALVSDQQAEFQFARETTAKVAPEGTDVFILDWTWSGEAQGAAMMGMKLARPDLVHPSYELPPAPRAPTVRRLDAELAAPSGAPPADGVLFLGGYRPREALAAIRARYELTPIVERDVDVVADSSELSGCPGRCGTTLRARADCAVRLGWYRFRRRP